MPETVHNRLGQFCFYGAVIPAEEAILPGTGLQIGIVYEMANIISTAFYAA